MPSERLRTEKPKRDQLGKQRELQMSKERGRPATFDLRKRKQFARLIRRHGVRGAREVSKIPVSQHTLTKVAKEFGISLLAGRRPSDPSSMPRPKFSSAQKAQLEEILSRGPVAAGYRSDQWTGRRITDVVQKMFSIKCHPIHLKGLLRKFGVRFAEPQPFQARARMSVVQTPEEHPSTVAVKPLRAA